MHMWDFFATVRHRHSVRKYQADMPVEREKLHAILEMACAAPSAGDLQAYHIEVVTAQSERDALRAAAGDQAFISEAPVCLVFCTDAARSAQRYGARGETLYAVQDATIAAAYAQLAIVADFAIAYSEDFALIWLLSCRIGNDNTGRSLAFFFQTLNDDAIT